MNRAKSKMRPLTTAELKDFFDWVKRGKPMEPVHRVQEAERVLKQVRQSMKERAANAHARRHLVRPRH